jgi:ABC-2 type transport system ATP-binding protein
LVNSPEIVFLDEPMSGLDPVGRREIRELIAGLREKGTTVFMSTHILSDVEALCDEVAILRGGKLAANGKLSELLSHSEGPRVFEVVVSGDAASLNGRLPAAAAISSKPAGTAIEVAGDEDLDKVLKAARDAGASIVSVNPLRQSLEELFVESVPALEQKTKSISLPAGWRSPSSVCSLGHRRV